MSKIVITLGGNALGKTPSEQKEIVQDAAKVIAKLVQQKHKVIVCHGNGPQVGMINNSFTSAYENKVIVETMPFAECGAMSQGYIGYHLQNAIGNEFKKQKINNTVVTLVTQTIVNKKDPGFEKPTKPIGQFMTEKEAKKLAQDKGYSVIEDAGRGWRRVVPSPKPIDFKEAEAITTLFNKNIVVIAGGGGGVPVYYDGNSLIGVDAVIDKDFTSSKLAELTNADMLIILTAVNKVKINFNKPNEESLSKVSLKELKKYIKEEQFAPGSMLPKVEAAMAFVKATNKPAYIGDLKEALEIIEGQKGTKIVF